MPICRYSLQTKSVAVRSSEKKQQMMERHFFQQLSVLILHHTHFNFNWRKWHWWRFAQSKCHFTWWCTTVCFVCWSAIRLRKLSERVQLGPRKNPLNYLMDWPWWRSIFSEWPSSISMFLKSGHFLEVLFIYLFFKARKTSINGFMLSHFD